MKTIIITPKFNKENNLEISLNKPLNIDFSNIKLCFSLVYSIQELSGASICKQVGRYYELIFPHKILQSKNSILILLKLQKSRIGSYNKSCGPEGLFIMDEKDNKINVEVKELTFDIPITKKKYDVLKNVNFNPVVPEPIKTNFTDSNLKNSKNEFLLEDDEINKALILLNSITKQLDLNLKSKNGIKINFVKQNMEKDAYRINILPNNIEIYFHDYGGKFYALITLLQLNFYKGGNLPIGEIEDRPFFKWRGMHLDCSRQYYSISEIKRLLIYMSLFKLNRFHWHLTDNEAWRLDLKSFPNLAKQSSFRGYKELIPPLYGSGYEKYGGYYKNEDVKDLISFAKKLNIEIMPEIDLPAHSWSLLQVMPELYDTNSNYESQDIGNYKNNTINPALDKTWNFLEKITEDISNLFSFDLVHVGVDERPKSAWEGSPAIINLMKEKKFRSFDQVQDFYMNKIINLIKKNNKRTAAWNEAALPPYNDIGSSGSNGQIDKNCVIFAWEHSDVSKASVKQGFETVMCPGQKTYYDMAYNNSTEERGICWAATIEASEIHAWKPLSTIDKKYHNLILGIQGQLWSETITKKSYFDEMINPRLATLAEVAWCSDNRRKWTEFRASLVNNMKFLTKLGWKFHSF